MGQIWTKDRGFDLAIRPSKDRTLPANVKSIARAIRCVTEGGLPSGEFRIEGARGLVLHVLPSGTATWYLHYDRSEGRRRSRRKFKIGRSDEVSLASAIQSAEKLRIDIRNGADPAADRGRALSAETFEELAEARFASGPALRPSTERDYRDLLRCDVFPSIGKCPAADITRQQVIDIIDAIAGRGSTRRADTARAVISAIFSFGIDRGIVQTNSASGMRNRHRNQPRDVILTSDQLRIFWRALTDGSAIGSPAMARILKLAMLTGQRRAEIASSKISDVKLQDVEPVLVISRERAKNHNLHLVPLSPQAVQVFRQAIEDAAGSPFVFPNPEGSGHILPRSVSKTMERNREKLGLGDIRVHDLRRTVGSMLTRYGVPRDIRERVLNHGGKRSSSITEAVYSWYDFAAEKRAALELWADALSCIIDARVCEIDDYPARLSRIKGSAKVLVS